MKIAVRRSTTMKMRDIKSAKLFSKKLAIFSTKGFSWKISPIYGSTPLLYKKTPSFTKK